MVPPALWTPLPASEPAKLLAAAKACRVQRLRLSLSLCLTPDPVTHPLVRVTLECAHPQTLSLFPPRISGRGFPERQNRSLTTPAVCSGAQSSDGWGVGPLLRPLRHL